MLNVIYLVWVVLKGTVITVISNTIPVCVSLVNIVHIWAVVILIQNTC